MKNKITKMSILFSGLAVLALASCNKTTVKTNVYEIVNGGFESANLSGWEIEYGDAFTDDCVLSTKTFRFKDDANNNDIAIGAEGNWYLSGKGIDGTYSVARTGAIRSSVFTIPNDGMISFKLAGGAITTGKGEGALYKNKTELCYLGIYRASDDTLLAMQTNEYFNEHTEPYVTPSKYESGANSTDNFNDYSLDLSQYKGEEAYIRIVDNDKHVYYGYLAVDDIRIGTTAEPQTEGEFFVKTRNYVTTPSDHSENEIANGGFEDGSLAGWEIVSGTAFSNDGVNHEATWWNENITYHRDGEYHYGYYKPEATGVMRSSVFTLGGTGYISYKLGGCRDNDKTYLRVMLKTEGEDKEIARFSNFKYYDFQFPYVANGMRLLNLVQYYADLSAYIGSEMYIEVVDNNTDPSDLGCIVLDSVQTYWTHKPVWYSMESYEAIFENDSIPLNSFQVVNGNFEDGFTGWTIYDEGNTEVEICPFGDIVTDQNWWNAFPYNKKGFSLFSGISKEAGRGRLVSTPFTLGGSGYITFRLGGGNIKNCYISVIDTSTNEEIARYENIKFNDEGTETINNGSNLANMVSYYADLSQYLGKNVRIEIVDNAVNNWGLITVDSIRTYYLNKSDLPKDFIYNDNVLERKVFGEDSIYQVLNGDFETGDFTGWTLSGSLGPITSADVWWNEKISYNKDGNYFVNGLRDEGAKGTLTSSSFTLGGCGIMTFKLGGGKNIDLAHIEILNEADEVIAIFGNTMFSDANFSKLGVGSLKYPIDANKKNVYMANMVLYQIDLTQYANLGDVLKIRVVDNATEDWGLLTFDSFVTYYETLENVPNAIKATNILG